MHHAQGRYITRAGVFVGAVAMLSGCAAINTALGSAANKAGEEVGSAAGQAAGRAIVGHYQPQLMHMYTSWLFAMAFGSGGYAVGETVYAPGDWTRFGLEGDTHGSWIERSRLANDAKGNQWWKVKYYDGEDKDTIILEALFDPKDGKMLRLRGLFPGDKEPSEMPVQEQTYYVPPQKLTPESLQGATVGTETIRVPAGTYTARHVRYGSAGDGHWDWWLAKKVPGGLVKYSETAAGQTETESKNGTQEPQTDNWSLVLLATGHDAKDELGAMPTS